MKLKCFFVTIRTAKSNPRLTRIYITLFRYGDKTPKGPLARLLAVVWIMISTIFLSLFTANASSIIAISQAEEDYTNTIGKTVHCLISSLYVCMANTTLVYHDILSI